MIELLSFEVKFDSPLKLKVEMLNVNCHQETKFENDLDFCWRLKCRSSISLLVFGECVNDFVSPNVFFYRFQVCLNTMGCREESFHGRKHIEFTGTLCNILQKSTVGQLWPNAYNKSMFGGLCGQTQWRPLLSVKASNHKSRWPELNIRNHGPFLPECRASEHLFRV